MAGCWRSGVLLAGLCLASAASAAGMLTLEGDARARGAGGDPATAEFRTLALGLRHTVADRAGDRVILFGLAEARDDLAEFMLHEAYARYKGPLAAWNVTAGRFRLPFGLLPGFTSERLLFPTTEERTLGFDADNGLMLSGQRGDWEYGLAATQGLGAHQPIEWPGPGLVTGRVGLTRGEAGEVNLGLSGAAGRSREAHAMEPEMEMERRMERDVPRRIGAVDATVSRGRATARLEAGAGTVAQRRFGAAYLGVDFALHPLWEFNTAGSLVRTGGGNADAWFVGLSHRPSWFTIRGGYRHARGAEARHEVVVQLYRLLALPY